MTSILIRGGAIPGIDLAQLREATRIVTQLAS